MNYKEMAFSAISSIDNVGILFSNGEKIFFADCVAARRELDTDSMCVAERDITAFPPYFEFFTTGQQDSIRIIFNKKGLFSKSKNGKDFHKLWKCINDAGYKTFDLS